jgi:uncharacterized protein (DUF2225 family)
MVQTIERRVKCPVCENDFKVEITLTTDNFTTVKLATSVIRHYTKLMDPRDEWPHAIHMPA